MNSRLPTVAFVGLGLMGSGMARRILAAGFPLTVFNRARDKASALVQEGASQADSPREAAEHADVVISMVADDEAAQTVWLGRSGALAGARPGTVLIESSTVTVAWIRELAAAALAAKCRFLDAPVTGSRDQAAAGELVFLVGGPVETLQIVRPVLDAMSRMIVTVGPNGSGAFLKLVNNFVCGVQIAALAEAIAMIERSGLDRTQALRVLTTGASGSPLVQAVAGRMMRPDYTPNFALRLMAKDLAYATAEARKTGLDLATAQAALAAFHRGLDRGLGEKDIAAVVEPLRQR